MARNKRAAPDYDLGQEGENGVVMVLDPGGQYFAVRRREWESDADPVHVWRGPREREQAMSRGFLKEVECQALREDKDGFWDCPSTEDEIRDDVVKMAEGVIENMANDSAAGAWSTPHDDDIDQFGDVYVVAYFGDSVGVNGNLVLPGDVNVPRGWEETDRGGRMPSEEEEIDLRSVAEVVAKDLSYDMKREIQQDMVLKILKDEYSSNRDYGYTTVSGEVEIWAPPEGIRERARREREARYRGGRTSAKVWSPRKKKR